MSEPGWVNTRFNGGRVWPIRIDDWPVPEGPERINRFEFELCPGSAISVVALALYRDAWVGVCKDGRIGSARIGEFPERFL